uniref:Putative reverse transcriptase domain-containing protein n=1 Tax=Tanacetum cinerariifolium TaxID=118510 RepID=A0A6L2NYL3_TANCI|nr:putative reverse transcriptase domain-containing protein [Tanacetum cinerariifolium]
MLKVSLWKGVIYFGKRGKLNPRVHNTFHVSNLKKCLSNEPLAIPLDEIHIDDKLHFVEELVEIMDCEVKRLNQSRIPIVKVRWNSRRGPEFTWEREDLFRKNTIPLNEIISQLPPSIVITTSPPVLPIEDPEEKSVTFSKPLFNSNDDFTSSDDNSLFDEDVPEDNVKIYLNPLFEFDDEYISSDVNPLFDEVIEDIECKDSYDSNLDESTFLVTPLFDSNEDEYFTLGYDVELLLHRDPSISMMSVASILEEFTDEPPLEEYDDLFDLEPKNDDWKKILYDALIDDLMTEDKNFDPGIHEKKILQHMIARILKTLVLMVFRPPELQSFAYGNPIS